VPFSLSLDILRYVIWQCKLNKRVPTLSHVSEEVNYLINTVRTSNKEISELYKNCNILHAGMNKQFTEVTGVTLKTDTGAAEDRTAAGTADAGTADDATTADNADEGCASAEGGHATDETRLLERGVELNALSTDKGEGDDSEEEMDGWDLTPEEAAAATAVLDANDDDQEGLVLTGGDWFNTIKQVAKTNKEAEKELAARMKKAKISLENEVFEGEPSNHSSADAGPGLLRKDPPPYSFPTPPPNTVKKNGSGLEQGSKTRIETSCGTGAGPGNGSGSGLGPGSVLGSGIGAGSGSGSGNRSGFDSWTKIGQTKGKGAGTSASVFDPPGNPR
jgi:hypothetical protein